MFLVIRCLDELILADFASNIDSCFATGGNYSPWLFSSFSLHSNEVYRTSLLSAQGG